MDQAMSTMRLSEKSRVLRWNRLLVVSLLIVLAKPGFAQTMASASKSFNIYDSFAESAFPWPELSADTSPLQVTLRFLPSYSPASEIVLSFTENSCAVEYLKAGVSMGRLIASRRNLAELSDRDAVIKALQVGRTTHRVTGPQAKEWGDGFWDSLTRTPEAIRPKIGKLQLDGTRYELQVLTGLSQWRLSLADNEVNDTVNGETPIVRWMNSIRLAVDALP